MKPRDISYDICRHYVNDLAEVVDPALTRLIGGYNRSRNLAELTTCSRHFDLAKHQVDDFRFLRQVEAFFKKNASLANKEICGHNAWDSFVEAEEQCHHTNYRLYQVGDYPYLLDPGIRDYLLRMVSYISRVLGSTKPFLDELPYLVRVTSGATSTAARRDCIPQLKLKMQLACTKQAADYLSLIYGAFGFKTPRYRYVTTSRVAFVPKNWKTDRVVLCEPEGNLPLQLAFDTYAKRMLKRAGIDLSNQSANQDLARIASITDKFVTVDFRNASNTVAFNLVSQLFPVSWVWYLWNVRTPAYIDPEKGKRRTFSKFSSMGNGTTFCIETLLFAAACDAVGSKEALVYGDDVIIERELYPEFLRLTRFLGLTINEEKTFSTGPFRESCGGDFFNGIDVTPVYIRRTPERKASWCHLVNTIRSVAIEGGDLEKFLLNIVKDKKLPLAPYNESTTSGVWIDPDVARPLGILRRKDFIDSFKAYVPSSTSREFSDSRGYYLWFLNKGQQVRSSKPWDAHECLTMLESNSQTSSASVYEHAYVRRRIGWHPPSNGTPVYLQWWTEQLVRDTMVNTHDVLLSRRVGVGY